jgi:hypothetical protein
MFMSRRMAELRECCTVFDSDALRVALDPCDAPLEALSGIAD